MENKDLKYWKNNCEEDYLHTPISVLRYIRELEKRNESAPELLEACQMAREELVFGGDWKTAISVINRAINKALS